MSEIAQARRAQAAAERVGPAEPASVGIGGGTLKLRVADEDGLTLKLRAGQAPSECDSMEDVREAVDRRLPEFTAGTAVLRLRDDEALTREHGEWREQIWDMGNGLERGLKQGVDWEERWVEQERAGGRVGCARGRGVDAEWVVDWERRADGARRVRRRVERPSGIVCERETLLEGGQRRVVVRDGLTPGGEPEWTEERKETWDGNTWVVESETALEISDARYEERRWGVGSERQYTLEPGREVLRLRDGAGETVAAREGACVSVRRVSSHDDCADGERVVRTARVDARGAQRWERTLTKGGSVTHERAESSASLATSAGHSGFLGSAESLRELEAETPEGPFAVVERSSETRGRDAEGECGERSFSTEVLPWAEGVLEGAEGLAALRRPGALRELRAQDIPTPALRRGLPAPVWTRRGTASLTRGVNQWGSEVHEGAERRERTWHDNGDERHSSVAGAARGWTEGSRRSDAASWGERWALEDGELALDKRWSTREGDGGERRGRASVPEELRGKVSAEVASVREVWTRKNVEGGAEERRKVVAEVEDARASLETLEATRDGERIAWHRHEEGLVDGEAWGWQRGANEDDEWENKWNTRPDVRTACKRGRNARGDEWSEEWREEDGPEGPRVSASKSGRNLAGDIWDEAWTEDPARGFKEARKNARDADGQAWSEEWGHQLGPDGGEKWCRKRREQGGEVDDQEWRDLWSHGHNNHHQWGTKRNQHGEYHSWAFDRPLSDYY